MSEQTVLDAIAELALAVDAIKLITDALLTPCVTVVTPLAANGTINIVQADDYYTAEGRGLTVYIDDLGHLLQLDQTGASAKLYLTNATWTATSIVSVSSGYRATFQPTSAQTSALTGDQPYQLKCVSPNGHKATVQRGSVSLVRTMTETL